MSEQQRLILAVLISIVIIVGFQWANTKWAPSPRPAQTTTRPAAPEQKPAPAEKPPAAPEPEQAPPEARPPTPAAPEQKPAPAEKPPAAAEPPPAQRDFITKVITGAMSNVDASLTKLQLRDYREPKNSEGEQPVSLATVERLGATRQAVIKWKLGGAKLPRMTWQKSNDTFELGATATNGATAQVRMTPRQDAYAFDYVLKVTNDTGKPMPVGAAVNLLLEPPKGGQKSHFLGGPPNVVNGLCATHEGVERLQAKKLEKEGAQTYETVNWAAIDRQYFVVAAVPKESAGTSCVVSADGNEVLSVELGYVEQTVAPGATWERHFTLFAGPKRGNALAAVSPSLTEVINYSIWGIPLGFLARPMVFLLNIFHGWTASWGLAIMLLTLFVKAILFPFTYKSQLSMRKMALLRPEMDRIKKQFENDRERQQLEQMKLFKEKGVNPFGGCLPMLLQMPVWFALYRMLWSDVDLYQQAFLWIPNLTAKEPWPVMALLLGALTYVQQKMTPQATDSQQAKIMLYVMPVMLTVFMIALPSGLVLYILTNSILTIVQQLVINRRPVNL